MRRTSHRALIGMGVVALLAAGFTSGSISPTKAAAATDPISFGTPTVMDPIHEYGEPNIGINPVDGSMYDSGPEGTGVQRSGWEGSVDGGQTFRVIGQCANTGYEQEGPGCLAQTQPNAAQDQQTATSAPGGGDAEQKFDSHGTQYFADLAALACDRVALTTDDGATAPESSFGCGTGPSCATDPTDCQHGISEGSDRQWLSVIDPGFLGSGHTTNASPYGQMTGATFPIVYEEYNNLEGNECSDWLMSGNPGNPTANLTYVQANQELPNGNYGCDGYPSVDQTDGVVLEASSASGCSNSGASLCLNIGEPIGSPDPGYLCFLDTPSSDTNCSTWWDATHGTTYAGGNDFGSGLITVATGMPDDTADLFVVSSIDSGRNLHVFWGVDDSSDQSGYSPVWQMWTTVAPVGSTPATSWRDWAAPVQVSDGLASTGDAVNIFPWGVAGAPGRSDMVWYGNGDTSEGPSSTSPGNQIWNVWMSQTVWPVNGSGQVTLNCGTSQTVGCPVSGTVTVNGAAVGSNSTVSGDSITTAPPVKVTPHPMQYGGICLLGTGCITAQGNRNVADFFEVNIDKNGAAVISYDDTANNILQNEAPSSEEAADHHGAAVITIGRQDGGPGLIATGAGASGFDVPAAGNGCAGAVSCWSLGSPNYQTATPTTGMSKAADDAYYPVIKNSTNGAVNYNVLDLKSNQLSLSGSTLTVTMTLKSLSTADFTSAFAPTGIPGAAYITYVTRWLMVPSGIQKSACQPGGATPSTSSCALFYVMVEVDPTSIASGQPSAVAAGYGQSIDLCSVSACFPHVIYYSEGTTGGTGDGGHSLCTIPLTCATGGSFTFNQSTGTITVNVPVGDVGNPTSSSLLEEVGSYSLVSDHPQEAVTNANAQIDDVPFEVDGICCFNFQASAPSSGVPETPWAPALLAVGVALIGAGAWQRRRLRTKRSELSV